MGNESLKVTSLQRLITQLYSATHFSSTEHSIIFQLIVLVWRLVSSQRSRYGHKMPTLVYSVVPQGVLKTM